MKTVQAKDTIILHTTVETVYATLANLQHYYLWWPQRIELNVLNFTDNIVNSELEVRPPTMGTDFTVRVSEAVLNEKLVFDYIKGIQEGKGTWTLKMVEQGTELSYEVDTVAKGFLVNFVSAEELHRIQHKFTQDLFEGLKKHLNA